MSEPSTERPRSVVDDFRSGLNRLFIDATADLDIHGNVYFDPNPVPTGEAPDGVVVRRLASYVPVSCCAMTDATGVNHCQHPPPPPIPRLRWFRWRLSGWWSRQRMRAGSWVAGVDLDREDS